MTESDIANLFIAAAETDRKLPHTEGPKSLRAQALPYFHGVTEKAGWIPADYTSTDFGFEPIPGKTVKERMSIKRNAKDQLEFDDGGRLDEEKENFWKGGRLSPDQVTEWELANELIVHIIDESERRCLWNWAISKAGGQSFNRWCMSVEHIHVETGRRRKDRAVASISCNLVRNNLKSKEIDLSALLPVGAQISDKPSKIREFSWRDDWRFQSGITKHDFTWAAKRNAARRARDAKRMQTA